METRQSVECKTNVRYEISNVSNKHIRFDELIVPENMMASFFQIMYEVVSQFKGNNGELHENKITNTISSRANQRNAFVVVIEPRPIHVLCDNDINDSRFFFTILNGTNQEQKDVKVSYGIY